MSSVVILGASVLQCPLIRAARGAGLRVVSVDNVPENVGHRLADASHNVSTRDVEGVLEIARAERAMAVLTCCSDVALPAVAAANAGLGLRGVLPKTLERWHPKSRLRDFQRQFDLPHPVYLSGPPSAELLSRASKLGADIVVKPTDRSGSRGVVRLTGASEHEVAEAVERAATISFEGAALIEEFVGGVEFGGDAWIRDGRVVAIFPTRKDMQKAVVRGHLQPAGLSAGESAALETALEGHVRHAEYEGGPVNFDVRITSGGVPVVLEIAPRLGGNWIPQLIEWTTGVDLFSSVIRDALGETPLLEATRARRGASFVIGSAERRVLEEDLPVDQILDSLGPLVALEIDFGSGDAVEILRDSGQQVGRALFDLENESYEAVTTSLESTLSPWLARTRSTSSYDSSLIRRALSHQGTTRRSAS